MYASGSSGVPPADITGGTPVLSQCSWPAGAGTDANGQTGLSDGTKTWAIVERWHPVRVSCDDFSLQWIFAGSDENAPAGIAPGIPGNGGVLACTVLKGTGLGVVGGGVPVDVLFGSATSYPIGDQQFVRCDTIPMSLRAGIDFVRERTLIVVDTLGKRWPLGTRTISNGYDGTRSGTGAGPPVDYLHTGTITPGSGTWTNFAACGSFSTTVHTPVPVVAYIGDSIEEGYNSTTHEDGFVQACNRDGIPVVRLARGGSSALRMISAGMHEIRDALAAQATDVVIGEIVNDFKNSADWVECATRLRTLAKRYSDRGQRVWQLTAPPSYNGSKTLDGSGPPNVLDANRTGANDWARNGFPEKAGVPVALGTSGAVACPYFAGYFERADVFESARNSGNWKPGMTGDNTHPSDTGHAAQRDATNLTPIFTAFGGPLPPPPPPPPPPGSDLLNLQMLNGSLVSL